MKRVQGAVETFLAEDGPALAERMVLVMSTCRPGSGFVRVKACAAALDFPGLVQHLSGAG